jgi:hypothetical protein
MLVEVVEERLLDLLPAREVQVAAAMAEIPGLLALSILAVAVAVATNLAFRQMAAQADLASLFFPLQCLKPHQLHLTQQLLWLFQLA